MVKGWTREQHRTVADHHQPFEQFGIDAEAMIAGGDKREGEIRATCNSIEISGFSSQRARNACATV